MPTDKKIQRLVDAALAIDAEEAPEAAQLGFICRAMAQATMPHRKTDETTHVRTNGNFKLAMTAADPSVGLPYGSIPRLLLAWLTTEAVRTGSRELNLGNSLSSFLRELDLAPSGGKRGYMPRVKNQLNRLLGSLVRCSHSAQGEDSFIQFLIADRADLWWDTKTPDQQGLWESSVLLGSSFYDEVTANAIQIVTRALRSLSQSPLALDLYVGITHRYSYLKKPTVIPWQSLEGQFGADYTRTRDFKQKFLHHLRAVHAVYGEARFALDPHGLELLPSPTHVRRVRGPTKPPR